MTKRFGILGRSLVVTLTAGVALGLAGCGDQGSSGPGYASKDNVVKETDGDAPLASDEIIPATYEAAMKSGSTHMVMTMKGQGATSAEGDVSYGAGNPAMRMSLKMPQLGSKKIHMRYVDDVIYMQIPPMTPAGKFIVIDPKDQSSPLAKNFEGLSQQMDPLNGVKSLESAVTSVDLVGKGDVDGTSADHYRVVVDAAQVMKKMKQPVPSGMPESMTYDLWLDEDDLIRKMTFGAAGTMVEMLLSGWGEPVNVQRPAAADIVKLPGA